MPEKTLWCKKHPAFYHLSVWEKRMRRFVRWHSGVEYCSTKAAELPFRVKAHQSVLIRRLGTSDPLLQVRKVTNLKIAIDPINGVLIRPGETFSFWKLVGLPTRQKGYVEGMLLARGMVMTGIGGGLCQLANLLHWMILHTPLTIVERHHHGFDPFPDDGRVLPFGSGATVFYNYIDLQVRNDTEHTFQVNLWVTDKYLKGEIRSDSLPAHTYKVFEKDHAFLRREQTFFRQNQIWRRLIDRKTGNSIGEELVTENYAEVRYVPESWLEE